MKRVLIFGVALAGLAMAQPVTENVGNLPDSGSMMLLGAGLVALGSFRIRGKRK